MVDNTPRAMTLNIRGSFRDNGLNAGDNRAVLNVRTIQRHIEVPGGLRHLHPFSSLAPSSVAFRPILLSAIHITFQNGRAERDRRATRGDDRLLVRSGYVSCSPSDAFAATGLIQNRTQQDKRFSRGGENHVGR